MLVTEVNENDVYFKVVQNTYDLLFGLTILVSCNTDVSSSKYKMSKETFIANFCPIPKLKEILIRSKLGI